MRPAQSGIQLREVLPRDGFQDLDVVLRPEQKIRSVEVLAKAGLSWIEVTSMVHPAWVPQFADADAVLAEVCRRFPDITSAVFVPNRRGLDRMLAIGGDEASLAVAATDALSRANFRMDRATAVQEVVATANEANANALDVSVTIGAAFGCPYEGEVTVDQVCGLATELTDAGVTTLFLADTIGRARPDPVHAMFSALRAAVPTAMVGAHFHGGNRAIDCVAAAIEEGATLLDTSLGGYGGCPFVPHAPGNIDTEVVVRWLNDTGRPTHLQPAHLRLAADEVRAMIDEEQEHARSAR